MEKNFPRSISFVLKWEGGLSKDKLDPGGTTNWGISQRAYPNLDIENLTQKDASKIYKKDYWEKAGCNTLPFPYDVLVFDTAVNCGVARASKWLGNARSGHHYLFLRLEHYAKLKNFNRYGRGWVNRVTDLFKLIEEIKDGN